MLRKDISFPTTNQLNKYRKSLRPVSSHSVLGGKGRAFEYVDLVTNTAKSILKIVEETEKDFDRKAGVLKIYGKDGGDGAGTIPTLKSVKEKESVDKIFTYAFTPLKLTQTLAENGNEVEKTVWENPAPNSPFYLRPIFLIRETEDDEDLLQLVIPSTDKARDQMNSRGITLNCNTGSDNSSNDLEDSHVMADPVDDWTVVDGEESENSDDDGIETFENNNNIEDITVLCNIKDTMKDMKFKKKISGLGGADCLLCRTQMALQNLKMAFQSTAVLKKH